jgi:hypothetical protein
MTTTYHGERQHGYVRLWATDESGAEVPWPQLPAEGTREQHIPGWGHAGQTARKLAWALLQAAGVDYHACSNYAPLLTVECLSRTTADEWEVTDEALRAWCRARGWRRHGAVPHGENYLERAKRLGR